MALFDIFSLLLLDKCHLTRHLTHWKSIFLALVGLSWKVVCSHSFLICLDIVRIKYGFLSLSPLLGYYSCSTPVFWRSDMWLTDTKREDLDRLIKWTPWYSTSCNSQSQFSTATIKIALKSNSSLVDHSVCARRRAQIMKKREANHEKWSFVERMHIILPVRIQDLFFALD